MNKYAEDTKNLPWRRATFSKRCRTLILLYTLGINYVNFGNSNCLAGRFLEDFRNSNYLAGKFFGLFSSSIINFAEGFQQLIFAAKKLEVLRYLTVTSPCLPTTKRFNTISTLIIYHTKRLSNPPSVESGLLSNFFETKNPKHTSW